MASHFASLWRNSEMAYSYLAVLSVLVYYNFVLA